MGNALESALEDGIPLLSSTGKVSALSLSIGQNDINKITQILESVDKFPTVVNLRVLDRHLHYLNKIGVQNLPNIYDHLFE
jgi:hypothetical protein